MMNLETHFCRKNLRLKFFYCLYNNSAKIDEERDIKRACYVLQKVDLPLRWLFLNRTMSPPSLSCSLGKEDLHCDVSPVTFSPNKFFKEPPFSMK